MVGSSGTGDDGPHPLSGARGFGGPCPSTRMNDRGDDKVDRVGTEARAISSLLVNRGPCAPKA